MKVGLIGAVNSTRVTLEALIKHQFDIALVMGFEPQDATNVSGHSDLSALSHKHNLPYQGFKKINDHVADVRDADLDVLFVVGLSQLVSDDIIKAPKIGVVGFHPTDLPKGRGRAPIAWLVANRETGAANFFVINEIADSGPIFVKERFVVTAEDDAASVEAKLLDAMVVALDRWLPELKAGKWDPVEQDHSQATEYGVRKPDDGLLDFAADADMVDRLIKAAAPPHPGAFTYHKHRTFWVLGSRVETELNIQGCVGRVLKVEGEQLLVQTGAGLIWLKPAQGQAKVRVGERLGYLPQMEIHNLYQQLEAVKQHLGME
ncbi:Bifunctional polymyxin resistance protein ArnA [Marinobacterium sp. xm-g-59]|uniref:methionyl-tRNA formyltransferase n=1 Tax=Marinobacterium sp. xm-g-59 TaxID=2497748 RepID=UPI0015691886|nr:formyltransferase family protein [Marinobacterium sp. xm-g-59]NRP95491.1 Bifunctional polymyxin resistance protein ArnA [Marinobacterium sp. xm-g-59]